jgi:hypothetical protein
MVEAFLHMVSMKNMNGCVYMCHNNNQILCGISTTLARQLLQLWSVATQLLQLLKTLVATHRGTILCYNSLGNYSTLQLVVATPYRS